MSKEGCGACGGFWKWLKPPHYNFFKNECIIHDRYYDIGGTKEDRQIADLILLRDTKLLVKKHFKGRKPISKHWYLFLCKAYYLAVRLVGSSRFNYIK